MKADKEQIRQTINMPDLLNIYGIRHGRNRIPCPIHNGKDNNFAWKSNSWTCYVCNDGGDIFKFVQQMNNCDFPTALDFICNAFGITNNSEPDPEFNKRLQERQNATRERERLRDAGQYAYNRLCAYRRYLAAQEHDNVERCHMLEYIDYLLDEYLSDIEGMGRDIPDADLYIKRIRKKWAG